MTEARKFETMKSFSPQQRRLNAQIWSLIMSELHAGAEWGDMQVVLESASRWTAEDVDFFGDRMSEGQPK